MRKKNVLVSVFIASVLFSPAIVQAADNPPLQATITSPASGSTVGRTFSFTGTANPNCNLMGYSIQDSAGKTTFPQGLSQSNGTFRQQVDISALVAANEQGGKVVLADGVITINVFDQHCAGQTKLSLNLQNAPPAASTGTHNQTATQVPASVSSATPSATSSVDLSVKAVAATSESKTAGASSSPWTAIIAFIVGGLLVAGAEALMHRDPNHPGHARGSRR